MLKYRTLVRAFNIFIFVVTLIAYVSTYISPEKLWVAGFLSLAIPGLLVLNVLLLLYYLLRGRIWFLFPLIALLAGYRYLSASFSVNPQTEWRPEADSFSVLNYNVRVFNSYAYLQNENQTGKSMIEWIADHDADVKCLQEFYNEDSSNLYNTFSRIRRAGQYQGYVRSSVTNRVGGQFGLAIFSRFPILAKGEVNVRGNKQQHAIYTDLLINRDTVRVYNVHLQSMSIDEKKMGDIDKAKENYTAIARKLRFGFINRAKQIDNLLAHIQQGPHRVIVCGDFNDIPYSYTYSRLKGHLHNAFEEAGNGLGFSYNGKLFFLRIDNQFYSEGLEAQNFETYRDVSYSDHYPVQASYRVAE